MEEESEEDPHGHITSLAVRRSHRWERDEYQLLNKDDMIKKIIKLSKEIPPVCPTLYAVL